MDAVPAPNVAEALKRRVERLLVAAIEGDAAEKTAKAQEALRCVPDDASGKLRAYGLYARGLVDGDATMFEEAAQALTEPQWQARLLLSRALHACWGGRLDEAEVFFERALEIIRAHGFVSLEPSAVVNLGIIHEARGDPQRGLELLLEARRLYARQGNTAGEGLALINAGPVYRSLGAQPEAIEALVEGLELLEGSGLDRNRICALSNLAKFYGHAGVKEEALRCAEQAAELAPPDSTIAVTALNALAFVHSEMGNHEAALNANERALAVARAHGDAYFLVQALLNLGDTCRTAGSLAEGKDAYREGLQLAASMEFLDLEFGFKLGLACIHEQRGEIESAAALVEPLSEAADRYGAQHNLIELHELLGRLAEARGKPAAALEHLKRAQTLGAERFLRETDVRVRSIQAAQELRRERERSADVLRELSRRAMQSQEEERRRVASDLHDDVGQRLALLAVEADMLAQAPPAEPERLSDSLRSLAERAQSVADQVHVISHHLHPVLLKQLGFVAATRAVCEEVTRFHDIEIDFADADVPRRLPDDVALCLYRIVQEGLNNAVRHAQAPRASVRVVGTAEEVRLELTDEGVGFDPDALESPGIGLAGMRERAHHLGGRFKVQSRPGKGTRIDITLPLPRAGDSA